jgi:hypothetical protein
MIKKKFVDSIIGYSIVAGIAVILGESSGIYFGRWSYAIVAITALAYTKNACGWEWK